MPYHIIVKKQEFSVAPKLPELFKDYKCLLVEEEAESGIHWHFWTNCDWKEPKIRRELDKIREGKNKGVSVRTWDDNLEYYLKGNGPVYETDGPKIQFNNIEILDDAKLRELHNKWWTKMFDDPDKNPDIKPTPVLDLLVEKVRDQDVGPREVCKELITIYKNLNGRKMTAIKSTGQAYIRTALLFTKNRKKYETYLEDYYMQGLFTPVKYSSG